jgi:hypothetical protein
LKRCVESTRKRWFGLQKLSPPKEDGSGLCAVPSVFA